MPSSRTPSGATGDGAIRRMLPVHPRSAGEARRALDELALPEDARQKVALLVSELVTNAVRHAGASKGDGAKDASIELLVSRGDADMHLAVRDPGPGFTLGTERRQGPGGLGFVIVEALSKEWGIDSNGNGCAVWCTFDLSAAA